MFMKQSSTSSYKEEVMNENRRLFCIGLLPTILACLAILFMILALCYSNLGPLICASQWLLAISLFVYLMAIIKEENDPMEAKLKKIKCKGRDFMDIKNLSCEGPSPPPPEPEIYQPAKLYVASEKDSGDVIITTSKEAGEYNHHETDTTTTTAEPTSVTIATMKGQQEQIEAAECGFNQVKSELVPPEGEVPSVHLYP